MGCPDHILHNSASKAVREFGSALQFNVEELLVDTYYWTKVPKESPIIKNFVTYATKNMKKF